MHDNDIIIIFLDLQLHPLMVVEVVMSVVIFKSFILKNFDSFFSILLVD